ncbi:MAG: ZPR1 zinc finger domain-containing protein [Candidatus Thermoplasmatota archaeon]|nr:ZPR1 zinc finger domain-containing protein [Candidatus Thermoplasmatota archaeon]
MESTIEQPCPVCHSPSGLTMIAHTTEIPYFGEHTQLTVVCDACGWKHTDFIPAEGRKPGSWSLQIDSPDLMSTRIVRSGSCTVRLVQLDLEASPGGASTGYVSNIEGVLIRFKDVIQTLMRDSEDEIVEKCTELLEELERVRVGDSSIELQLLDPLGHSQILHEDAIPRELSEEEVTLLDSGPMVPVFDSSDFA